LYLVYVYGSCIGLPYVAELMARLEGEETLWAIIKR